MGGARGGGTRLRRASRPRIGNLLRDLGRYDEALRIFDRAVARVKSCAARVGCPSRRGGPSPHVWPRDDTRRHGKHGGGDCRSAGRHRFATSDGNRVAGAISEYHLAAHYLDHGDLQSAEAAAVRAEQQCREMDMPGRAFKCRVVQARVRLRMEEWDGAVDHIKTACVAAGRDRPMPDDGLTDAIDVLLSTVDRVPQACQPGGPDGLAARGTRHEREALRPDPALKALLGTRTQPSRRPRSIRQRRRGERDHAVEVNRNGGVTCTMRPVCARSEEFIVGLQHRRT